MEITVNLFRPDQLKDFMDLLDVLYFDQDARFRFEYDLFDINEYREHYLRLREYNVFIAKTNGLMVGYMIGEHLSNKIYDIKILYVHPEFRRAGVARKLKQALIDHATEKGYELIQSKVRTNNKESIALNHSFGWTEERDNLRPEWYYWYFKELKKC